MRKGNAAVIISVIMMSVTFFAEETLVTANLNPPAIEWSKSYSYGTYGGIYAMIPTADGGFALGGTVTQLGTPGATTSDMWLLKVNSQGDKLWEQGLSSAYLNLGGIVSLVQADDGGYVLAGESVFGSSHLVKTDSSGNVVWTRAYDNIALQTVIKCRDNGYAVAGTINNGNSDFWLAKITESGAMQWNQTYGGINIDLCNSLIQTSDGGFALAGSTSSFGLGNADMWLIKTDSYGSMVWNQTYGTQENDAADCVIQTTDNNYVLSGYTMHTSGNNFESFALSMIKTDSSGKVLWSKTYSQHIDTTYLSVIKTKDSGYALASDFGIIKTDSSGAIQWSLPYGGTYSLIQIDNAYILAGTTSGSSAASGWIASTTETQTIVSPSTQPATSSSPTSAVTPTTPITGLLFYQETMIAVASMIIIIAVAFVIFVYYKRRKSNAA